MKKSILSMTLTSIVILCAICSSCSQSMPNEEVLPANETSVEQQSSETRAAYWDIFISPNHPVLIPGQPYDISFGTVVGSPTPTWEDGLPEFDYTIAPAPINGFVSAIEASGTTQGRYAGTFTFPVKTYSIWPPSNNKPSSTLQIYKITGKTENMSLEKEVKVARRPVIVDFPLSVNRGDTYTLPAWGADPSGNSSFSWKGGVTTPAGAVLGMKYTGNAWPMTFNIAGTYVFVLTEYQSTYGISVDSQVYTVTVN
jgi:hypothetical protein